MLIQAKPTDSELELVLAVNKNGPVTGLTAVVAVRDANTPDSWLDFADNTFKTSGWTTREAAMTEQTVSAVAQGRYRLEIDPSAIAWPSGARAFSIEYRFSGSEVGITADRLEFGQAVEYVIADQFIYKGTVLVSARIREFPDKATYDAASPDVLPAGGPYTGGLEGAIRVHQMTGDRVANTGLGQFTPNHWRKAQEP